MKIQINFVSSFGARKTIFNIFVLLYMLAPLHPHSDLGISRAQRLASSRNSSVLHREFFRC